MVLCNRASGWCISSVRWRFSCKYCLILSCFLLFVLIVTSLFSSVMDDELMCESLMKWVSWNRCNSSRLLLFCGVHFDRVVSSYLTTQPT